MNDPIKNKTGLLGKIIIRFGLGIAAVVLIIFIPAGTIGFYNGWIFCLTLFIPMIFFIGYAYVKMPDLLERRTHTKEKEVKQKRFILLTIPLFLAVYIIPGLDFRFGWSRIPYWLVIVSDIVMFSGYIIVIIAMAQNTYASRVIEVAEGQKVIDTGLYSVIRHPLYSGGCLLYVSSALVLGSFYALIPAVAIPLALVFRILNEEEILKRDLPGYADYLKKVRYRLIPFVW
jgi:protein-S-isoprenylcysteine O-methyltransferase Ste14